MIRNCLFLFICMLYCHIIDDYCLQGILASLKQKAWWNKQFENELKNSKNVDEETKTSERFEKYRYDYIVALVMHAISWSCSILIPIVIFDYLHHSMHFVLYACIVLVNAVIHALVDNEKANRFTISLLDDQLMHIIQIFATIVFWKCVTF